MTGVCTSFSLQFLIYKITNQVNGKIYIGKHQTKNPNDDYFGSGLNLKRAITKYGKENFNKEILHVFDNESDMNAKEAELVTEEFCKRSDTYNICEGGKGGFGYINREIYTPEKRQKHNASISRLGYEAAAISNRNREPDIEHLKKISVLGAKRIKEMRNQGIFFSNGMLGKKHSDKWKEERSINSRSEKNSQYGSKWITNGIENRKIKAIDIVPEGWYYGRVLG